jgi:2-amino-4-hydroxy-6-hydroxymethyldihydropteridine diphosphokinase
MTTAYIGVGSNLGDRLGSLARAIDSIEHVPDTHVEKVSHAYESISAFDENQPHFLNAVVEVESGLQADALLGFLLEIETDMGRVRESEKGPRVIDLDLLLFGEEEWSSAEITLPHPGVAERDFVVTPLLEIAPRTELPDGTMLRRSGATVGRVLRDLGKVPDVGAPHNMPVGDVEWEVIAESASAADTAAGFDAGLQLKQEVLEAEGIPFAYSPYEPGVEVDPFGIQVTYQLLVPAEHAQAARALIAAVEAAPPEYPPGLSPEE